MGPYNEISLWLQAIDHLLKPVRYVAGIIIGEKIVSHKNQMELFIRNTMEEVFLPPADVFAKGGTDSPVLAPVIGPAKKETPMPLGDFL
jgi:hypothetical protein